MSVGNRRGTMALTPQSACTPAADDRRPLAASDHGRSRGKKRPAATTHCGARFGLLMTPELT